MKRKYYGKINKIGTALGLIFPAKLTRKLELEKTGVEMEIVINEDGSITARFFEED